MLTALRSFLGPGVIIGVLVGAIGGIFGTMKLQKPQSIPACPDCICPEPSVTVQPFDVEKIKGLREFNYSPAFTGSIQVAGVDSAALRKMIDRSVDGAFKKYMITLQGKKKSRKASNIRMIAREAAIQTDKALGLR